MFGISPEELEDLLHTKLACSTLAFDCLICKLSLLLLKI